MTRRLMAGAAVLALSVLVSATPAAAASTAPAYRGDFPDPHVLAVGRTYWAYSTGSAGRNLQVMSSPDLRGWTQPVDPLPVLPAWARAGLTWAPAVLPRGGAFLMYYTVRDSVSDRQCVSVAESPLPGGPFTDSSTGPLLCQVANGGSIDPSPFVTATGTAYLLWKSDDNALGRRTYLWSQRLSRDGRSLVGAPVRLLSQDQPWQAPAIESPTMVAVGPLHYLFYGANRWDSADAAIGYAVCTSPLGPCVNVSVLGPWMASHGQALGPGGPAVFVDGGGATRLAYHAWTGGVGYQNGGARSLWIDNLGFLGVIPVVS